jgi:hypothetical protein
MFVIRNEQLNTFAVQKRNEFLESLIQFLYDEFPESKQEPPVEFREVVSEQIEKSRSYGLQTEQEIATYVVSAWLLGTDFDTRFPVAQETLSSDMESSNAKMVWLQHWTHDIFATLEGA